MRVPFAPRLIADIAPELGITVDMEPEFGFAGELTLPDGRRHLFRNTNFNINPAASCEIAKDKDYTKHFLRKHGLHVAPGRCFFSERLNANLHPKNRRTAEDACRYAEGLGFPVFVKPNNLSQGTLVTQAWTAHEVRQCASDVFLRSDVLLVEQSVTGRDYRVVVLADEVISAYERVALSVVGDGARSVAQLLAAARDALPDAGRPNSEIDVDDRRIRARLTRIGRTLDDVPTKGESVQLLDNANLSTGGSSVDCTEQIHPEFARLCQRATNVLGLRLAGVDVLCADITQSPQHQSWVILELNAAPGLDNYAAMGEEQARRVRGLYRQVLEYLVRTRP